MQRLHEDDLVGHLIASRGWELLSLPAIVEEDEVHVIRTLAGQTTHSHSTCARRDAPLQRHPVIGAQPVICITEAGTERIGEVRWRGSGHWPILFGH